MEIEHLGDGGVLSGSTASIRGFDSRVRCPSLTRGIVVRYQARDESTQGIPTVDVLLPRYGFLCQSVPLNVSGAGANGSAWTPTPCSNFDLNIWDSYDPDTLDGDRVVVGFVDDDPALPVVVGVMPSKAARWLPVAADGAVRTVHHQGTVVTMDKAGNVTIDVPAAASLAISVAGQQRINVENGKVAVVATEVDLGAAVLTPLDGVVTGACLCAFTGVAHPVKSAHVRAKV